jgi:hypothetical protein
MSAFDRGYCLGRVARHPSKNRIMSFWRLALFHALLFEYYRRRADAKALVRHKFWLASAEKS